MRDRIRERTGRRPKTLATAAVEEPSIVREPTFTSVLLGRTPTAATHENVRRSSSHQMSLGRSTSSDSSPRYEPLPQRGIPPATCSL